MCKRGHVVVGAEKKWDEENQRYYFDLHPHVVVVLCLISSQYACPFEVDEAQNQKTSEHHQHQMRSWHTHIFNNVHNGERLWRWIEAVRPEHADERCQTEQDEHEAEDVTLEVINRDTATLLLSIVVSSASAAVTTSAADVVRAIIIIR